MTKTTNSIEPSGRPHRVPVSARNRLVIRNQEKGYKYRIVNDVEDRVNRFLEGGYEIVPANKVGTVGDNRVDNPSAPGSSSHISVGQGTKAVVMRIKEQYYNEDQAAKQAVIDELEGTMKNAGDYGDVTLRKANESLR
jgi:hypothetical protein